jgi:Tol biopolymer transport system component
MYIYEYDWSPDGRSFVATAASGDGDANWWVAQLYTISVETGAMKAIYKPPVQQQVAVPRWSPDSKSIVFIGGLMSDEGSTGGDVFQIPVTGGTPRNLTPRMATRQQTTLVHRTLRGRQRHLATRPRHRGDRTLVARRREHQPALR